ncbi:MAG: dihydroorotase [Eubacteriales bacterium]
MRLFIKNGLVVDPVNGTMVPADVYIEDGSIVKVGAGIDLDADEFFDASGLIVAPALVDMHVHLRDPGFTEKEDILSGCAAAALGGVTTMACMANTNPVLDNPEQLRYVIEKAAQGFGIKVLPVGAVTQGLQGKILTDAALLKAAGAIALSDDGSNVDSAHIMREALLQGKKVGLPILAHCEDSTLARNKAVNEGSVSRQLFQEGRPAIAEELMVMRDVMLAEETGAHVHICHVSTAKSVDIIRKAKKQGINVTCETCPQYFVLTEEEVLLKGPLARVNPPLRTKKDVRGIVNGLKDGVIDCIVTDHAPHTVAEKSRALVSAPSGMIGLETSLALSLTALYHTSKMFLPQLFSALSTTPSKILGLKTGVIAAGRPADLVIFDPQQEWQINSELFASKARNTPFDGFVVKGRVKCTIANGTVIHREGRALPNGFAIN